MNVDFLQPAKLIQTGLWNNLRNSELKGVRPNRAREIKVPQSFAFPLSYPEGNYINSLFESLYNESLCKDYDLSSIFTPETLAFQTRLSGRQFYNICQNFFGRLCTGALPDLHTNKTIQETEEWLTGISKQLASFDEHKLKNNKVFTIDNKDIIFQSVGSPGGNTEAYGYRMFVDKNEYFLRIAKDPTSEAWLDFGLIASHFMVAGPFQNMMNPYWCNLKHGLTVAEFISKKHEKTTKRPGCDWITYIKVLGISKGSHDEAYQNNLIGSKPKGHIRVDFGGMKFATPEVKTWRLFVKLILQNPDPMIRYNGMCSLMSIAEKDKKSSKYIWKILQRVVEDEWSWKGLINAHESIMGSKTPAWGSVCSKYKIDASKLFELRSQYEIANMEFED